MPYALFLVRGDTFVFAEDDDEQMSPTKGPGRSRSRGRQFAPSTTPMTMTIAQTRTGSTADMLPTSIHTQGPSHASTMSVPSTDAVLINTDVADVSSTADFPSSDVLFPSIDIPNAADVPSTISVPHTTDVTSATVLSVTTDVLSTQTTSPSTTASTEAPVTAEPTQSKPDPDADACSGRPFDAFLQLKNGTVFAFRGELCPNYIYCLSQSTFEHVFFFFF